MNSEADIIATIRFEIMNTIMSLGPQTLATPDDVYRLAEVLLPVVRSRESSAYRRGFEKARERATRKCKKMYADHYMHSGRRAGAEACAEAIHALKPDERELEK